MKEIWKPVKGYESLYQVSDNGRVRSSHTGKYISQRVGYDGYVRVSLSNNGEQKALFLHRLIGQAFVPNPNNYPEINHKDENKQNNSLSNLEWCTHKYNSNYGTRVNRMATTNYEPVIQYTKDGTEVARYQSQKEAMDKTGISNRHISCCCKGKRKTCGGYVWRYTKTLNLLKDAISAQ